MFTIEGATHIHLYDRPDLVPQVVTRLTAFYPSPPSTSLAHTECAAGPRDVDGLFLTNGEATHASSG